MKWEEVGRGRIGERRIGQYLEMGKDVTRNSWGREHCSFNSVK